MPDHSRHRKAPDMPPAAPGSRSKYWHIAAGLFAAVERGDYAPGARLPGENDIMRDHGVARSTARQALALLVSWGLAEARKGSGVYVRSYEPVVREGIRRLSAPAQGRSVWADETAGRNLGIDQVEISEAQPPGRVRALLEMPEGSAAVLRSRRYTVDGKPVMLSRSWLPFGLAAGTAIMQADTGPGVSTRACGRPGTRRSGSARSSGRGCSPSQTSGRPGWTSPPPRP